MFLIMLGLHRLAYAFTRAPTRNSWLCLVAVHVLEACGFWALATRPHFQAVAAAAGATDSVFKLAMLAPLELIVVPLQAVYYLLNAPSASAKPHSQ